LDTIDYATEYYQNGMIKSTGTYSHMLVFDNKWKVGFWSYWDEAGKLTHTETYYNNCFVRNTFDTHGELIKSEYYEGYNLIKSSTKFEYDEFGNIKGRRLKNSY
jgi:antitoxin component YwqK of YwqJK toxin-antitoxin module